MHRWPLLMMLLLAGCSDDSLARNFNLSRDSAPENVAATQMPLSMPPELALRPRPSSAFASSRPEAQPGGQEAASAGQEALVQAAGPAPSSDIRAVINENSGLVYPDRAFVDRLMNWTPPPGYTPVIREAPPGGWLSRVF